MPRYGPQPRGCSGPGTSSVDAERRSQLDGVAALLELGPLLVPAFWQLPPKPMDKFPPNVATVLAPVIAAARKAGDETMAWLLELLLARSLDERPRSRTAPCVRAWSYAP